MRRRTVLSTIALLPLAGCLDSGAGGDGDGTTTDTTTRHTTDTPDRNATKTPDPSSTDSTPTPESDWTTEFEPVSAECGSEDAETASVVFGDAVIEVSGTIIGADPCWLPQLEGLVYDEMTRELEIVISSRRAADADTACAQCLAALEYHLTVTFSGPSPASVAVVHARDGSERTITQATR